MKRTIILSLLLAGCGGPLNVSAWSPRARYVGAAETYAQTVEVLATYRSQGAFAASEAAALSDCIVAGQHSLDRWHAALILGQQPGDTATEMSRILRDLVAARLAAERKGYICPPTQY